MTDDNQRSTEPDIVADVIEANQTDLIEAVGVVDGSWVIVRCHPCKEGWRVVAESNSGSARSAPVDTRFDSYAGAREYFELMCTEHGLNELSVQYTQSTDGPQYDSFQG